MPSVTRPGLVRRRFPRPCAARRPRAGSRSSQRAAGRAPRRRRAWARSTSTGTNWRLIGYLSPTGTHFTVPAAVTPGATFADGQFQGDTGCNTASGPFTQNGTAISIGPLASTKKACQEPMETVETAYLAAISVVDTAVGNATTLLMKSSTAGFTALEFVRAN